MSEAGEYTGEPQETGTTTLPENIQIIRTEGEQFSENQQYLIDRATAFLNETDAAIQDQMHTTMQENVSFSPRLREHITERGLDRPRISVVTDSRRAEVLDQLELEDIERPGNRDSVLVVVNLPKPLDQFWQKGESMGGMVAEYGTVYGKVVGRIWETENEKHSKDEVPLKIRRINRPGQHTDQYYYVWDMSLHKRDYKKARYLEGQRELH